jgi:sulfate permease, SulP family
LTIIVLRVVFKIPWSHIVTVLNFFFVETTTMIKRIFSKKTLTNVFPFIPDAKAYTTVKFKADILAGLTVAVVGTPQVIAYAIIAGVDPRYGLYAYIVPVIIASLMGSSRFLVAGPTNTISMVIFATISTLSIGGVAVSSMGDMEKIQVVFMIALVTGVMQVLFGLARAGNLLNFISHSVIVGFTAGAGILIGVNQIKNLFGLTFKAPTAFIESTIETFKHIYLFDWRALALGVGTIVFVVLGKRISPKFPASLIALVISAFVVFLTGWAESGLNVVGTIPRSLPPLSSPFFSLETLRALIMPAFAIAILGVVEAYSVAKSLASKVGEKVDGNQELVGQGLANIGAGFFSGLPGTGSFTRSAVNFSSHAATRFAATYSALIVLVILLIFADGARYIPIASLAGILIVIAYSMIDKKAIVFSCKATIADRIVLIVTMLATLFLHIDQAIYIGVVLSIILFLRKVSHPSVYQVLPEKETRKLIALHTEVPCCPQISIFQVDGSIFFGAVAEIEDKISEYIKNGGKNIIIRLPHVRLIDATGAHALNSLLNEAKNKNVTIFFTNIKEGPRKVLKRTGMEDKIGSENFFEHTHEAIEEAVKRVCAQGKCKDCPIRCFEECTK